MMAGFFVTGALLLVLLTGSIYSYPTKKGYDPSPSLGSSPSANRAPAGGYVYPASGSEAHAQAAPASGYSQPSVKIQPVASSYSPNYAPPAQSDYASSSSGGPAADQDIAWLVAPPSLLAGLTPAESSAQQAAPSNVGPRYQGGELSHYEKTYEHGDSESETEEQGFQPQPSSVEAPAELESVSEEQLPGPSSSWPMYPFPYDYRFLTGQYPPGTITHSSESYEQGADHWQDARYIRYHLPAYPVEEPVEPLPPMEAPKGIKQPSQPVKQSTGYPSQPRRVERPVGMAKVGY